MDKYASSNLRKYHDPFVKIPLNRFLRMLGSLLDSLGVSKILDAGCGEGLVARYLISRNKNLVIEGIDINEQAILAAKQLCPGVAFYKEDIRKLKYPDKSFDLALAIEVLEHLEDPEAAIAELRRLSSKYCIFSVPLEPYFRICNLLLGKNIKRLGIPPEHLWNWSPKQFRALLGKYFEKIKLKTTFPWLIAVCKVNE